MIKKLLVFLFAVVLVCSSFVGCSGSTDGTVDQVNGGDKKQNIKVNIDLVENILEDDRPYGEKTLKEVLKEIRKCVVEVYAVSSEETETISSGIVYACGRADGEAEESEDAKDYVSLIITCYHVVENARRISVCDIDGNVYSAIPVGADDATDVCVLKVENAKLTPAAFLTSDSIEVGEDVVAVGNPLGALGGTVTKGIVSAVGREVVVNNIKMTLLQTDAAINGGNAGGGLFTLSGVCIGMVNAKYARVEKENEVKNDVVNLEENDYVAAFEGLSFAVPSSVFLDIADQLIDTYTGDNLGYILGRYYLGCTVKNRYTSTWGTNSYVSVSTLDEKGSLYKGGLRVDDKIESVEYRGQEGTVSEYLNKTITVTTAAQFSELMESFELKVGDKLVLNIVRGQASGQLTIEILQYVCGAE